MSRRPHIVMQKGPIVTKRACLQERRGNSSSVCI